MFFFISPILNFSLMTLMVFGNYSWFESINMLPNPLNALLKITTSPALLFTLYLINFYTYFSVFNKVNKLLKYGLVLALISLIRPHHFTRLTYSLPINVGLENPLAQIHPPMLFVALLSLTYVAALLLVNGTRVMWFNRFRLLMMLVISFGLSCLWAYQELFWGSFWNWDPVEFSYLVTLLLFGTISHLLHTAYPPHIKNLFLIAALPSLWCFKFLNLGPTTQSVHSFSTSPISYLGPKNIHRMISGILLFLVVTYIKLWKTTKNVTNRLQSYSLLTLISVLLIYTLTHTLQNNLQLKTAILSHGVFIKLSQVVITLLGAYLWTFSIRIGRRLQTLPPSHIVPLLILLMFSTVWYLEKRTTLWNSYTNQIQLVHHNLNMIEYNITSAKHNSLYYYDQRYLPSLKPKHKHLQTLVGGANNFVSTIYHIPNSPNMLVYLTDSPFNLC